MVRVADKFRDQSAEPRIVAAANIVMTVKAFTPTEPEDGAVYTVNEEGLGFSSGTALRFDAGEALEFTFDRDVIVEICYDYRGTGKLRRLLSGRVRSSSGDLLR